MGRKEAANVAVDEEVIVLKENKKSVLIACWNCGKQMWVKKGSQCHKKGVCGNCIGEFKS